MLDKVFKTLDRSVDLKEFIGDKEEELIKDLIDVYNASILMTISFSI